VFFDVVAIIIAVRDLQAFLGLHSALEQAIEHIHLLQILQIMYNKFVKKS
jgi:hypothetical protein